MSETKYPRRTVLKGALLGVAADSRRRLALVGREAAPAKVGSQRAAGEVAGLCRGRDQGRREGQSELQAGQHARTACRRQGKAGEAYIPCNIFPGKLVNAKGWCKVWVKRP